MKNDLPVENIRCDTAGRVIIFKISKRPSFNLLDSLLKRVFDKGYNPKTFDNKFESVCCFFNQFHHGAATGFKIELKVKKPQPP